MAAAAPAAPAGAPGIAKLWKPVVNVTDLDEGERFWSAVSGLSPVGRHGQFSVLDAAHGSDEPWMLLQHVPVASGGGGGVHLDFRVEDVARAVEQVQAIGGRLVTPPAIYETDGTPMLEWSIMADPFGNEFCLIRYPL